MQKNPYLGKPSTKAKLSAGLVPHLSSKEKNKLSTKWFVSINGKPILPRKKGAGFIVFDGLDGSGMSTQAAKLVDFLNEKEQKLKFGHTAVYLTKEPTSSLIGGLIKSCLTHDWKSSPECLQLLFSVDRAYHLEKEIIPLLEKGVIVVCDRYFFSTLAFGSLGIKDFNWLLNLQKNFLIPDITFFLKVSPKICLERIKKERFGITLFEKEEIMGKVWRNYEKLAKKFKNIHILNGERPVKKISHDIKRIITKKLS